MVPGKMIDITITIALDGNVDNPSSSRAMVIIIMIVMIGLIIGRVVHDRIDRCLYYWVPNLMSLCSSKLVSSQISIHMQILILVI